MGWSLTVFGCATSCDGHRHPRPLPPPPPRLPLPYYTSLSVRPKPASQLSPLVARCAQVIGEPVDTELFDPEAHHTKIQPFDLDVAAEPALRGMPRPAKGALRFLSVFNWELRKNPAGLLAAYFAEFAGRNDVVLYLRSLPPPRALEAHAAVAEAAAAAAAERDGRPKVPWVPPPLMLLREYVPQERMPALYAAADVFVIASHGEGWGRPHAESMSMGLPVIATNWSGTTAFLDETVGYPVRVAELVSAGEDKVGARGLWTAGHQWAQPDIVHLRQRLAEVVSGGHAAAEVRGRAARARMVTRHGLRSTGTRLLDLLRDLANDGDERGRRGGAPRTASRGGAAGGGEHNSSGDKNNASTSSTTRSNNVELPGGRGGELR